MYQHFTNILDAAFEHDDYFKIAFQNPDYDSLNLDHVIGYPGISISAGVSRATIIDECYDWVCKLEYAQDMRGSACEREFDRYQDALCYGIADLFAPVQYLGTYRKHYKGYDIDPWNFCENDIDEYEVRDYYVEFELYAYKKANTCCYIGGSYNSLSKAERAFIDNKKSPLAGRSCDVAAAFLSTYGVETYLKLNEFCIKHNINDLHGGNIGYLDDNLVLIDYAGYYDEEDSYEDFSTGKY